MKFYSDHFFHTETANMKKQPNGQSGFTTRAAIIAVILALFLLASSSYIAIKLGALPWPIIFSVIAAGGFIKLLSGSRKLNVHEINVAQAGASIGGLIAAGLVFTVPGILYLNRTENLHIPWPNPWILALSTIAAGLLGILLSVPLKYTFIDKEQLPYPAGTAGAELLKLGQTGGRQLAFIIMFGAGAGMFALLRDMFFSEGFTIESLTDVGIFITLLPLPLAVGGGYILGARASFSWLAGAVVGWLLLAPVLVSMQFEFNSAKAFAQNLGMGMVLGSGMGFFASYVIPRLKQILAPVLNISKNYLRVIPFIVALCLSALLLSGLPYLAAILTVLGVWLMVAVAARMTGETNIDPLEQFGIFIGLVVSLIYKIADLELTIYTSFMIVTFVSVACAVAGDAGHDFKSAHLVGTRFFDIVKVDAITVIAAGLAAPFVLELIHHGFADKLFTPAMPAPQAQLVAGSIFGFEFPRVFLVGFLLAFTGEIAGQFVPEQFRNKLLLMPMGIGLFLGIGFALPIALGAAIRSYIDKTRPHLFQTGLLIAAGVMGGEGIAGFSAGGLTTAGLPFNKGAAILLVSFALVFFSALMRFRSKSRYQNQ